MLIILFLVSLCLIVLGRPDRNPFGLSGTLRKSFRLAGQFALGFCVGFTFYTHGAELMNGFLAGFSSGKDHLTQQP